MNKIERILFLYAFILITASTTSTAELLDKELKTTIKASIQEKNIKESEKLTIDHATPNTPVDKSGTSKQLPAGAELKVQSVTKSDTLESLASDAYDLAVAGYYESAIVLYKKALTIKKDANILYSLGVVYHKLRDYDSAGEFYRQALLQDPTHHMGLSNYLAIMAIQDPDYALKELLELEHVNPDFAPVLGQIGLIYAKKYQYEQAEIYMKKAITKDPNELQYIYNLAVMYDKYGYIMKARHLYSEIVRRTTIENRGAPVNVENIRDRIYVIDKTLAHGHID